MTRVVGTKIRDEFIREPAEAWRRGRELDRMLGGARAAVRRGVVRAPHAMFNRMDDRRMAEIARRVNGR